MPLLDLQRRMRELGRIRTGEKVRSANGTRPAKLETFRLTSPSRPLIEAVAAVYGGTVKPWEGQWEVKTTTDTLGIVIPPGQSLTQWWESWTGGGCMRRCDGETELLSMSPCLCQSSTIMTTPSTETRTGPPTEKRLCKPTTRLSVILPAIPDIGVWRLESHGYYAAVELAGTAELLAQARSLVPARLRLEQREKKVARRIDQDMDDPRAKPTYTTLKYAVPVIEVGATVGELIDGLGGPSGNRTHLLAGGDPEPAGVGELAGPEAEGGDDVGGQVGGHRGPGLQAGQPGTGIHIQQRTEVAPIWEGVTEG